MSGPTATGPAAPGPRSRAANSASSRTLSSGIATWFDHHAYSLVASAGRIFGKPWATALTVGVMAVALALPLGLWATLSNVERFAGDVQEARRVSVFLKPQVGGAQAEDLAAQLRLRADVAAVELRTPEQGLAELRETAGLGATIDTLDGNPLPSLLVITPAGDETTLARSLLALPEADLVQHDAAWRQRLDGWLAFGARLAGVLAVLLGAGALLVVGNTVRLDVQQRREEIEVLQLLGATDGFIRRPFLYLGTCYGVLAGLLALAMLSAAQLALKIPLSELARSYGSGFALQGFALPHAASVVLGAGLLGLLGAGLVTGHTLRQTRPTDT